MSALAVCNLCLMFSREAKRYMPEMIVTLETILFQAPTEESQDTEAQEDTLCSMPLIEDSQHYVHFEWLRRGLMKKEGEDQDQEVKPLSEFLSLDAFTLTRQDCDQVLSSTLRLVQQLAKAIKHLPSADSLLEGIQEGVDSVVPSDLSRRTSGTVKEAVQHCRQTRAPLRLQEFQDVGIQVIEPRFQGAYAWKKNSVRDQAQEAKMLRKQVRRERKGVARELRRDAAFLTKTKERNSQKRSDARRDVRRKNLGFLEGELK